MTTLTKLILSAALICGVSACAAATNNADSVAKVDETVAVAMNVSKTAEKHYHRETVKPGADVSLNSVLPKFMTSGTFQTVQLQLSDGYPDGVLTVSVEPSQGLSLFGGANSKTFNMATPGPHDWDVDVKAEADGVYFLNVFAEAQGMPRSFSVRINIGQVTQKMFDDAMPADGELGDGGKIRILDAEETIK